MARKARTGKGKKPGWLRSSEADSYRLTTESEKLKMRISAAMKHGACFEDVFQPEFKRVFGERGQALTDSNKDAVGILAIWLGKALEVPRESVQAVLDALGFEPD